MRPGLAEESLYLARAGAWPHVSGFTQIHSKTAFCESADRKSAGVIRGRKSPAPWLRGMKLSKAELDCPCVLWDTHFRRTKKESLLIVVDLEGKVLRIEATASEEPPEYRATSEWYQQYHKKALDDDLYVNRAIRPLAGATLTGMAANQAVRRIMATDKALERE
jgi:hypothetical protein